MATPPLQDGAPTN
ncbi:hypothetical protein TGRUB_247410A, partial [Toxoplasma gondii RUB]